MYYQKITTEGVMSLISAGFLIFIGIILGSSILILLGLFTILLIITAFFIGKNNVKHLATSIDGPRHVRAKQEFTLRFNLHSKRNILTNQCINLKYKIIEQLKSELHYSTVQSEQVYPHEEKFTSQHRAYTEKISLLLDSSFPIGLFKHSYQADIPYELAVYPYNITPKEIQGNGSYQDERIIQGDMRINSEGDIRSIREWQSGDLTKHIHWSASALSLQLGKPLCVREFDPPSMMATSSAILFHSCSDSGEILLQDRYEKAISLVAGCLSHLRGMGIHPLFCADFTDWTPTGCESIAEYNDILLSLAKAKRRGGGYDALQASISSLAEQVDQVIIISDTQVVEWKKHVKLPSSAITIDINQSNSYYSSHKSKTLAVAS